MGPSLHGCKLEEATPVCTLEDLWADWEHVQTDTEATQEDMATRMPEECCNTLRAYLTEKHYIDEGEHKGKPSDELLEQAKAEEFQKTLDEQDLSPELYDDIKQEMDKRGEGKTTELSATKTGLFTNISTELEKTNGTDPDELPELDDADPVKEKAMKEDAMARLQEVFDEAFCNMDCQDKVHGKRVKMAVGKMCAEQSSFIAMQRIKEQARLNVSLAERKLKSDLEEAEKEVAVAEHELASNVTKVERAIAHNVTKAEHTFKAEVHHAVSSVEHAAAKAGKLAHRAVAEVRAAAAHAEAAAVSDVRRAESSLLEDARVSEHELASNVTKVAAAPLEGAKLVAQAAEALVAEILPDHGMRESPARASLAQLPDRVAPVRAVPRRHGLQSDGAVQHSETMGEED